VFAEIVDRAVHAHARKVELGRQRHREAILRTLPLMYTSTLMPRRGGGAWRSDSRQHMNMRQGRDETNSSAP